MSSIWKQNRDVTNNVKRNNFDLSYQSHSTFKFGYLYPVFCKPVYPTDSFRIRSAFDLKMMPLAFPLQSRIRAHMHFFYVRNKNLWTGWEDYISGLKDNSSHPHPYISPNDTKVATSSIYDFLGVPTSVIYKSNRIPFNYKSYPIGGPAYFYNVLPSGKIQLSSVSSSGFRTVFISCSSRLVQGSSITLHVGVELIDLIKTMAVAEDCVLPYNTSSPTLGIGFYKGSLVRPSELSPDTDAIRLGYVSLGNVPDFVAAGVHDYEINLPDEVKSSFSNGDKVGMYLYYGTLADGASFDISNADFGSYIVESVDAGVNEYSDLHLNYYKYNQPLNALPFRAYESIYRGYYANDVWQPLVIDGEKEYNKFVTNNGDGQDTVDYHLFRRNYELDFLTSAMPSPQAGPAPMVGITALGDITITDANGVSTGQAEIDSSGVITKVVATSPLASVEHARTMMNFASAGFNINDLRSANALQRMAEQTLRSGFRYVNWVKGQFGRSPEYRELDMPEFIGGFSRDVVVNTVVSQSDTHGSGDIGKYLGDYGANGRVVGGSNHDITHYCDDYGWIIGIMCITPTPAYSQLLPKHMLTPLNNLGYANPFMNQLGMQPITYREVCPIQAYMDSLLDDSKSVDDTFGYQRPNYDLVSSVDEVHGEFRKSLHDYLIHRQFDGRPELGSDFLEINPAEVNDVFINQNPDDDVFIGHLAFQVSSKRPFPRVHVPGLKG